MVKPPKAATKSAVKALGKVAKGAKRLRSGRKPRGATVSKRPGKGRGYTVHFETKLNPKDLGRSRDIHFRRANAALDEAFEKDPAFAREMEKKFPGITEAVSTKGGRKNPPGCVWHHEHTANVEDGSSGVMRLVPKAEHTPGSPEWPALHPGGSGGYSEWAIPLGAPPN